MAGVNSFRMGEGRRGDWIINAHWRSHDFSTGGPKRGSEATERGGGGEGVGGGVPFPQ